MTMYFLRRRISSPLSRFSVLVPSEGTEPASAGRVPSGASPAGTCPSSMLLFLFSILLGLFNGPVNTCYLSFQGIGQPAQGIREAAFLEGKLHALPCRCQPAGGAQQDDTRCDAGEGQHRHEDAPSLFLGKAVQICLQPFPCR
nr:hypothetical protein [Parabacteroides goldsteinii]